MVNKKSLKYLIVFLLFGVFFTVNIFAAPLERETTFRLENANEVMGRDAAHFQGRVIRISASSTGASAVRENALIRATWEADRLGYEYFIILAENNNASQSIHTRQGYPNTTNIDGSVYTVHTPGSFRTGEGYSVVMIILCCTADDINKLDDNVPIFSVSSRLSQAQQILRKRKGPGIYFEIGMGFGKGSYKYINENNENIPSDAFLFTTPYKLGFGPFGNIPIYMASEVTLSIFPNNEIIGYFFPGASVLYYPLRNIQLGISLGPVFPIDYGEYEIDRGFLYNISAAYDIDLKGLPVDSGLLLCVQYSWTTNNYTIHETNVNSSMTSSSFSFILKWAFRRKIPSHW